MPFSQHDVDLVVLSPSQEVMMLPITGPHNLTMRNNIDGAGSSYINRLCYRQKKPYTLPLPYGFTKVSVISVSKNAKWTQSTFGGIANATSFGASNSGHVDAMQADVTNYSESWWSQTANEALGKYRQQMGEQLQVWADFVQRRQAIDMMARRAGQLFRMAVYAKRGDLKRFIGEMGLSASKRRIKRKFKDAGDMWLEYHFGWSPMVQDIYHACDMLSWPFPSKGITGSARLKLSYGKNAGGPSDNGTWSRGRCSSFVAVKVGAVVEITNANAFLADRLGLTNPAAVAWELVPFSFLVDWFVNVGQLIDSWSDWNGVRVRDSYTSYLWKSEASCAQTRYFRGQDNGTFWMTSSVVQSKRTLGHPSVKLGMKPAKRLSLTRAATAISLLLQQLR